MPFLSLLDDRAKPKGSRDPLGFELVWSHYGREVIGNLTTITSSLSNFAVAILGFHWANEIHGHLPEDERQVYVRDSFLRYEQLAGYLRFLAKDEEIMGITRVRRRMGEPGTRVTFGLGAEEQILSDQASYGLWGLYSAAMRDTGLVKGDNRIPTEVGLKLAQEIEARLDKGELVSLFSGNSERSREALKPFAKSYLAAISKKSTRQELLHNLMNGNEYKLLQQEMWRMTQGLADSGVSIKDLPDFIKKVKSKTQQAELKDRLTAIEQVERILVAANNIFHYCRRKDGESLNNVLRALSGRYSYSHLPDSMDFTEVPRASFLRDILKALLENNVSDALVQIFELNRVVMEQRGGAPWVEIENGDTLRVRVQSETSELKDQKYLETGWDYDYFIGSFIRLAEEGLGARWKTQ